MKRILLISLALLTGCSNQFMSQNEEVEPSQDIIDEEISSTDFKFNLDISTLGYELPLHTMVCIPEKKISCSKATCTEEIPTVFLLYNESIQTLYRCDSRPCDAYLVEDSLGGAFRNLKSPNKDFTS